MAYESPGFSLTLRCPSTSWSTRQYRAVIASSSAGYAALGSTVASKVCIGILQDAPTVAGEAVNIMNSGISKFYAGVGGAGIGDTLCMSTAGLVRSSTSVSSAASKQHLIGVCLEAASSGGMGTMLVQSVGITT